MANNAKIQTSIHGRRLGLQVVSSSVIGSSVGSAITPKVTQTGDILCGPDAFNEAVSTAETTTYTIVPWGLSEITTATGGTTNSVFQLGKPIPGVSKYVTFLSSNTATNMISLRASSDATVCFESSVGSTMCVLASSAGGRITVMMIGLTSTSWGIIGFSTANGLSLTTST